MHLFDVGVKAWRIYTYHCDAPGQHPTISVIVCAHDEEENLQELLSCLLVQTYPLCEIIIVLDRCTDGSAEVVRSYASEKLKFITIDTCPQDTNPKKNALTIGIRHATSEWILLTDADCRPAKKWIAEMARGMTADKEVVIGISQYQKKKGLLNLLIQYETFTTALHFMSSAIMGKAYMGVGRNLAYRKSAFEGVDGFEKIKNILGGDDDLQVQRMVNTSNVGVVLTKESHVESIPKTDWKGYIRQKTRHFGVNKYYSLSAKKRESLRWSVHVAMWVLLGWSIVYNWILTLVILVLTFLIKAISINIVSDRLEKRFNLYWLPFVDVGYVVIFPLLSLRSFLVKRITWK
jgi:cellulose synthase/poly-beta-1,6-N-acetylglucosamine synthase-like glycosyltransferase